MFKLFIAWSREAANYAEEKGFLNIHKQKQLAGYWAEKEFETQAELNAYCQGLEDGNGWDAPFWQQVVK